VLAWGVLGLLKNPAHDANRRAGGRDPRRDDRDERTTPE
jgi:hypothetical protein